MDTPPQVITVNEIETTEFDLILDVRARADELPIVEGAVPVSLVDLVSAPSDHIASKAMAVLIICDVGLRSSIGARALQAVGFESVRSLDGGMEAWVRADLPVVTPTSLSRNAFARYDRQIKLPDFGVASQQALSGARIVVAGAGGLGSPAISYLAAAGVGHMTIIDSDIVEISNLHRQPLYTDKDIGQSKAERAASTARELNPEGTVESHAVRLTPANTAGLLVGHDAVVLCTDNMETTHAVNAAAVSLGIPMVFASVYRTEGQFAIFDASQGPCYACAFPEGSSAGGLDCSIVGVLGPVTGVLGSIQAVEVVKLITGSGDAHVDQLHLYDARSHAVESFQITKRPDCPVCS